VKNVRGGLGRRDSVDGERRQWAGERRGRRRQSGAISTGSSQRTRSGAPQRSGRSRGRLRISDRPGPSLRGASRAPAPRVALPQPALGPSRPASGTPEPEAYFGAVHDDGHDHRAAGQLGDSLLGTRSDGDVDLLIGVAPILQVLPRGSAVRAIGSRVDGHRHGVSCLVGGLLARRAHATRASARSDAR